jgi:hypothetical protein
VNFGFVTELPAVFEPWREVFALTDIEILKMLATVCHSLDSDSGNAYTTSN